MATTKKSTPSKKADSKRTLIAPNGDKRYIRRNDKGQITESDDVGKSLGADIKKKAKKVATPGQGDKGDQAPKKTAAKKAAAKKAAPKKSSAVTKAAPKKSSGAKKTAPKKSSPAKK